MDVYTCTKCHLTKPLTEFYRHPGRMGHRPDCKACKGRANLAWRKAHPDKARANDTAGHRRYRAKYPEKRPPISRRYYLKHTDRITVRVSGYRLTHPAIIAAQAARRRERQRHAPRNDFTAAQWQAMKAHYGHCCVYCARHMQRLTMDHLTPLAQGGSHTLHNIVPACKSCNSRKRDRGPLVPVQPLLLL